MSEDNNSELITTEAELLPAEPYDFEFIASTLGLIPYQALSEDDETTFHGALNPGAIINFEITEEGYGAFTLHGGEEILMRGSHLSLFERTLRQRIEETKVKAKESARDQIKLQIELAAEMQSGVVPGSSIVGAKRGRWQ